MPRHFLLTSTTRHQLDGGGDAGDGGGGSALPYFQLVGQTIQVTGLTTGYDATGVAQYVVVPAGGQEIAGVIAVQNGSGELISGAQLNPLDSSAGGDQGYDARIAETFDAGLSLGATATIMPGDVLMMSRGADPKEGSDGYLDALRPIYVVETAPVGVLPAPFGWDGSVLTPDLDAAFSALTLRDVAAVPGIGALPDAAEVIDALARYPIGHLQNLGVDHQSGYENLVPNGFNDKDGSGYSYDNARRILSAAAILADDGTTYAEADRRRVFGLLLRIGIDCALPIIDLGLAYGPDGGHRQAEAFAAALAMHALGRSAEIATIPSTLRGSLAGYFRIDQAFADAHFAPHDDLGLNVLYRRRTLGDQSGTTLNEVVIPTQYGGAGGIQGDWEQIHIPPGSIMTRPSDGATAIVQVQPGLDVAGNPRHWAFPDADLATSLTIAIDAQPDPAFGPGDVIHFEPPAGTADVGLAAWALRGLDRPWQWTPSARNLYAGLRTDGGTVTMLQALGLYPADESQWGIIREFRDLAERDDWPAAGSNNWPAQQGPLESAFSAALNPPASAAKRVLILSQSQGKIASVADTGRFAQLPTDGVVTITTGQTHNSGTTPVPVEQRAIVAGGYEGSDAIRAMMATYYAITGREDPVEIVFDSIGGTSVVEFLDDSDDGRRWSDLQEKLDAYGTDFDAVLTQWDTANASPLDGDQELDLLLGLATHGFTVDHTLTGALDPGFVLGVGVATRHAGIFNDAQHSREEIARANELGLPVGMPVMDYYTDGSGPHPDSTNGDGNVNLGRSWGVLMARALGVNGTPENPHLASAERSEDGTYIDVTIEMPNGGQLYSPAPNALGGWAYTLDGSLAIDTGFTAVIQDAAGGIVRLTRDSGPWEDAQRLGIFKRTNGVLNDPFDAATEQAIVDGELYETDPREPTGKGWPVAGALDGEGKWHLPVPTLSTIDQAGLGNGGAAHASLVTTGAIQDSSALTTNRERKLQGAFPGVASGDEYVGFIGFISDFTGSNTDIYVLRAENNETVVGNTVDPLLAVATSEGGKARSLTANLHRADGQEDYLSGFSQSRKALSFMGNYRLDLAQITLTGAQSASGADVVTMTGVTAGSTILAMAQSFNGAGISWTGVSKDAEHVTSTDFAGSPRRMALASGGADGGGIIQVRADGADQLLVLVLPPV
ncbi:MAG: hypothetical protein AAGI09_02990 [Pseudomonadota bacterium]